MGSAERVYCISLSRMNGLSSTGFSGSGGTGWLVLWASLRAWMAAAEAPIRRLVAALPVACLATALEDGQARGRERLHLAAAQWMEKRGYGPNDGLVPVDSALIDGARHVVLPGSHIASVSRGPGRDPVAVMRAGLDALFGR